MFPKINICITCVGGRLIYDIIRSIRDADDYQARLIGVDANKNAHGRLLCDKFYVVPDAEKNPKKWLERILQINKSEKINILLVFSEGETLIISKNKKILAKNKIKIAVNDYSKVVNLIDKYILMKNLKEGGLDVGFFSRVGSKDDCLHLAKKIGYPPNKIVFKPRISRGSRGVLIADKNLNKLKHLVPNRFCLSANLNLLLRECLNKGVKFENLLCMPHYKGDVWDVDILADNGNIINIAARIRQLKNPYWPTSTGHKSSNLKKIIDYATKACNILKLSGPNDFDIVLDEKGVPKILDAASRYSGSVGVSYISGINILSQTIRYILKLPYKKFKFKEGLILRPYITMTSIPIKNELDFL